MSADNWAVCPRCHEQYEKDLAALEEKEEPTTLREDYEQGIMDGEYYLRYSALCSKCGWEYNKKIDEKVYP